MQYEAREIAYCQQCANQFTRQITETPIRDRPKYCRNCEAMFARQLEPLPVLEPETKSKLHARPFATLRSVRNAHNSFHLLNIRIEVKPLIEQGLSRQEIAKKLGIGYSIVRRAAIGLGWVKKGRHPNYACEVLIREGKRTGEIAEILGVSESAVSHVRSRLARSGVKTI